ncbi:hypothetical protein BDP81DRAFT_448514 [Colletotrichum phormii]|uniref:ATP-dependent DNA helicase n=1 Tax=Colletotrichum phormii TaxID=359342 RepID=A0AAJ0EJ15_9PEZI|nr:uncharacterized protein BDP81DRAFT_448514 [Colletotrichum phormii]KAK1638485.1 hypothetical protein BDP81DRAFT_448514 [Colletotrichum phormii]
MRSLANSIVYQWTDRQLYIGQPLRDGDTIGVKELNFTPYRPIYRLTIAIVHKDGTDESRLLHDSSFETIAYTGNISNNGPVQRRHDEQPNHYTINPNDLTNEVNMKLAAFRVEDGPVAEELIAQFRKQIGRVQHVVRDPVSSAKFFHREMDLFFKHLIYTKETSIFNIANPNNAGYGDQVCEYIDSVFSECGDEAKAKQYRRWETVFDNIKHITQNMDRLAENYDNEANMVACRCRIHVCGATCTKYSINDKAQDRSRHPCRFKAPWAQWPKTEFTPSGLLRIQRNHDRINRYCPALAVAMRHNTDSMFLPTNSASLSMIYYATNYSTKLDTPLWKRIALMLDLFDGLDEGAHGVTPTGGSDTAQTAQRNNKTRQFFARLANQIFTSREISSVENWGNITLSALYWVLFRRWNHLRDAADPETRLRAAPEFVSFGPGGRSLPALEAYTHRGPILEELCFYDYVALELRPIPKQAVPVMSGYLDYDLRGTEEGFYQRSVYILLGLFVPWGRAEDAKKDAKLWASRNEGDEGLEFDLVADEVDIGVTCNSDDDKSGGGRNATRYYHIPMVMAKRDLNSTKAVRDRLHKERMLAIEGDEMAPGRNYIGVGTGFDDDVADEVYLVDPIPLQVFAAKELSSRLVITATSGTAAAGIGGTTIHSAVGLTFKDQDGQTSDTTLTASLDKAKQRWRRRDVLVIDEVSMLGLPTLYDIDQKLRMLRGFADKPFGGMPVVIFTGDFLQFPLVNQSSLLKDFTKLPDITTHTRPNRNASEKRWKEMEA